MPAPVGPLTEPPVVLLTVTHAGREWRAASQTCDIQDADGRWRHYQGGLAPLDVYQEAPLFEYGSASATTIEAMLPADFAALAGKRHMPGEMNAELALYRRGDRWERRLRMAAGSVTVGRYGQAGQTTELTIEPLDPAMDESVYPPTSHVVSDETWSTSGLMRYYDPLCEGKPYPTIQGAPGLGYKQGAPFGTAATPAYPVRLDASLRVDGTPFHNANGSPIRISDHVAGLPPGFFWYLLVAGHWIYPSLIPVDCGAGPVQEYGVTIWDTLGNSENGNLYFGNDALGNVVALVTKTPMVSWTVLYGGGVGINEGNTYYASWPNGSMGNRTYDGPMRHAGDIVRYALEQSALAVDWRRTGAALRALRGFELGGYWDEQAKPWAWLTDNILPLLPVSVITGPDGLYPVSWRWNAKVEDAKWHAHDGVTCCFEGEPREEGRDRVISASRLDYARGLVNDVWRRHRTWTSGATRQEALESPSLPSRLGGLRFPGRDEKEDSEWVYRNVPADLTRAWRMAAYSRPWRVARIVGDGLHHRSGLGHLEPGDVVRATSSRYGLTDQVAHVRRAGWRGGLAYADLVIL